VSVSLKLINYDTLYENTHTDKMVINNIDIFSAENKEMMDNLILTNFSEDNLSIIPSCHCGELKGSYYVGDVCYKCNTTVISLIEDNISFLVWVKQAMEVEKFISPIVMAILLRRYKITKPNISLIKYIMLPKLAVDKKQQKKNMDQLEKLDFLLANNGITRGYNSFIRNFYKIIEILESEFVKKKVEEKEEFKQFLIANESKIFSSYLPFPNKIIFSMDTNELGKFIDRSLFNPINVIRRLTGIDLHTKPSIVKQTKVASSVIDLAEFYVNYMKGNFFSKPGLIRQHISSTRCHFTARAVITSIHGPHVYDEIHIPWSLACTLFRESILNSLYKRGYSYKEAINFLTYHIKIYNPIIDEIFKEIIALAGGIKGFFNRNPSLHRGSIQTVTITKVKTDPEDNTFSFSLLIMPSLNADLDGDALQITLALTNKVSKALENFHPHHNVLGLVGDNEFSSNIKYPKTIISTLSNWYND